MEKVIPVNTNTRKFFKEYLRLINPLVGLRGKELDVMAELLYYNYEFRDIPEEHRWKLIFDYDTKTDIRSSLGLSDASMNNNLSSLRKRGLIVNNRVAKFFWVYPEGDEMKIVFKFNLEDGSGSKGDLSED